MHGRELRALADRPDERLTVSLTATSLSISVSSGVDPFRAVAQRALSPAGEAFDASTRMRITA